MEVHYRTNNKAGADPAESSILAPAVPSVPDPDPLKLHNQPTSTRRHEG